MADEDDPLASLKSTEFGIGQTTDGKIDSFPLSELQARIAERDRQEAETDYAIEHSEPDAPEDDLMDDYVATIEASDYLPDDDNDPDWP